jgi:hypothetical protein
MATLRCSSFRDLTPRRLLSSAQIASAVCLWSESHKATKGRNEISCQSRSLGSICDSHKSSIRSWNHSYCLSKNTYIALSPLRTQTATMAANPLFAIAWLSKVRKLREAPFANHFTAGSYLNMRAGSDLHILRRSAACKTSAGGVESIFSGENQCEAKHVRTLQLTFAKSDIQGSYIKKESIHIYTYKHGNALMERRLSSV